MARARFLHTADLHLSRPFGFLPRQLAEERRRDQRGTLTRIADLAVEREVDIVLVAGDLFDTPEPDPTDLEAVIKEFQRLIEAGKRVFVIPGNHDSVSPSSFWRRINIEGVHVFLEPEWSIVPLDGLGIAISGVAFHKGNSERRAFEGIPSADVPTIALVHASYEVFEGQLERYHPFSASDISGTGATYIALGHYHRFNPIRMDGVTACYPGTPEGISFDSPETGDRFVIIGEIDDGKTAFEPVKVNRRAMKSEEIDCTSFDSQASLFDVVRRLCELSSLVEIKLAGIPTSDVTAVLEELPERFKESCHYLALDTSSLLLQANVPDGDRTIRGLFYKHMLGQMESASDPDRRRLLQRALEVGLAAFSED